MAPISPSTDGLMSQPTFSPREPAVPALWSTRYLAQKS